MATLYPAPLIIAVDPDEGYKINPHTGESIQTLFNKLGDTVKSGVPLLLTGRSIRPEGLALPRTIAAGDPKLVSVNLNVFEIPEALTIIPVNLNSLETFTPGVDSSSAVLVSNSVPITRRRSSSSGQWRVESLQNSCSSIRRRLDTQFSRFLSSF